MRTILLCSLFTICLSGCAETGTHSESHAQVSDDEPCRITEERLNATVGQQEGVPRRVVSMRILTGSYNSQWCHMTLEFADGTSESGVLELVSPGGIEPQQIVWLSDKQLPKDQPAQVTTQPGSLDTPHHVSTCPVDMKLSDNELYHCRFPKPSTMIEVDNNPSVVYQWQAEAQIKAAQQTGIGGGGARPDPYGNERILKLVAEQVCWKTMSDEIRDLQFKKRDPHIDDEILSDILKDYDYGMRGGGYGPWGQYTSSYLQHLNPDSVLNIVKQVAEDAIKAVRTTESGPKSQRLVSVRDASQLIDVCAQTYSEFITY